MKHGDFQKKINKLLVAKGCWTFNIHGEKMQKRGVPDLLVIGLRWKGFLEFKIGKDKCSPIQKVKISEIQKRKFPCYVLRYDEELDAIQIENEKGEILNLVAWQALWDWLKNPVISYIPVKEERIVEQDVTVIVEGHKFKEGDKVWGQVKVEQELNDIYCDRCGSACPSKGLCNECTTGI